MENKKSGKLKWIIIVVIVIAIIGAAMSGGDDEKKKSEDTKKESTETVDTKEEEKSDSNDSSQLTVGSSFEKNGLKIKVNDSNADFQDYDNEYGWNTPEEGKKYIMVSFTFENNGSSDAYVSIYDFDCYADNETCDQVYSLDDDNFINTNLSPGRNVSFNTYYSVPVSAQSIELEYETNIWTGKKAVIKIQQEIRQVIKVQII